jgi:hypothetical protein
MKWTRMAGFIPSRCTALLRAKLADRIKLRRLLAYEAVTVIWRSSTAKPEFSTQARSWSKRGPRIRSFDSELIPVLSVVLLRVRQLSELLPSEVCSGIMGVNKSMKPLVHSQKYANLVVGLVFLLLLVIGGLVAFWA